MKHKQGHKAGQTKKVLRYPAIALAAVVIFVTTYSLILPALTLEQAAVETEAGIELLSADEIAASAEADVTPEISAAEEADAAPAVSADGNDSTSAADASAAEDADAGQPAEAASEDDAQEADTHAAEQPGDNEQSDEPSETAEAEASAEKEPETSAQRTEQSSSAAKDAHLTRRFLTADGKTYDITVIYEAAAKIPKGAELDVREIPFGSDEYQNYLRASAGELGVTTDEVTFARFFDISITEKDGTKIEPEAPVSVLVEYVDALEVDTTSQVNVVHFAEQGTEVVESVTMNDDQTGIAWQQDSFSVTGTLTIAPNAGTNYMVLVQYAGTYYIVNNDGSLTAVPLDPADNTKVLIDDPMMWTYTGSNLYHNSIQVDFGSNQCASDYYYRYINPNDDDADKDAGSSVQEDKMAGISRDPEGDESGSTGTKLKRNVERSFNWSTWQWYDFVYYTIDTAADARSEMANAALTYDGSHLKSRTGNNYIGLVIENGVPVRITGKKSEAEAADIVMAKANDFLQYQHYLNNTVNHIDISIVGTAGIDIPLAYGDYYNEKGEVIKTVTEDETLNLTKDHVGIKTDDMKRARIEAFTIDPATGKKEPLNDAFVVTGYSANAETDYSTDQVRIEGVFQVSTHHQDGRTQGYDQTWYNNHRDEIWRERKEEGNRVYYTITAVKPITFDLVDPTVGQLYDSEGNKLTITVDVAFSASFDYWDSGNECPPLQYNTAWQNGDIPDHNLSGMDFVLGGNPEDINSQTLAIEITKMIVDENGNRIKPQDRITNTFNLFYNTKDQTVNASSAVKENGNEKYNKEDYTSIHQKTVTVGSDGLGLVYDYDVKAGMYYIQEDAKTIPAELKDTSGQDWHYQKTYIKTEYAWRNGPYDSDKFHTSPTYTYEVQDDGITLKRIDQNGKPVAGDADFTSIPEVLGNYAAYNGDSTFQGKPLRNGFLEFFVYNVYESPKVDVPVIKNWTAFNENHFDWEADFQLQWAPLDENGKLTDNFRNVTPAKTLKITKSMMQGITKEKVTDYLQRIADPSYDPASLSAEQKEEDSRIAALTFGCLPKYTTDTSGKTVRIQYSLEELSYKVTDTKENKVYTWNKTDGYQLDGAADDNAENHFQAFYPHDAGEDAEANTDYYVEVTNAVKNVRDKDTVTIQLHKEWDKSITGYDRSDRWAEFELRRFVHTEYRDLSRLTAEDILADPITVQVVDAAGALLDSISVQPNTGLYLAGNFVPHTSAQTIRFTYPEGSETKTVEVTAAGSNASKQLVRSAEFFVSEAMAGADRTFTITLTEGADKLVAGAKGARILDTSGGTDPLPDAGFSQTVRLDSSNEWSKTWENLDQSETSQGDDDNNENVTLYEYYLVEKGSSPEGFAQYFLAGDDPKTATQTLLGDVNNRIEDGGADATASVVAVNGQANRLKVEKVWRGVPDATGYPEIQFTLYQGWADDGTVSINSGDSWPYQSGLEKLPDDLSTIVPTYENVSLTDGAWTWTCPEDLPETIQDKEGRARKVGYYVKESADRGTLGNTTWQFYYYANSNKKQSNAYHQPGGAGLSGEYIHQNGGMITICNQMGRYLQMDVKKQFFMLGKDGSWANVTATTDVSTNTVLGFKVIRSIQLPDGTFLDKDGNVSATRVWMDYGDELLVGYDENGNAITRNGGHNDFYLESGGGDWHFRIRDEQGGANNREIDKIGLPANGYYVKDGASVAVSYAYSFRETGVYKDLERTPYENWQWFSSVTPDRYVDSNGQHSGEFGIAFAGQDGERVANFQASDLQVTKEWTGDTTDVQEVYVKIYRIPDGGSAEDFTAIIADDILNNQGWQQYIEDENDIDTTNKWLVLKNKGKGEWTVSHILVNRALLGSVDKQTEDFRQYTYYIKEVGFKDAQGTVHTSEADVEKFHPVYSKWVDGKWITTGSAADANTIRLGQVGDNRLEVTNKTGPSTSYTVTKKFANDKYPADGSVQATVELQQRYRYEKEKDGTLYVLKKDGNYDNDEDWIAVSDAAAKDAWMVDWQSAENANPTSVTLPRPKPAASALTDAQWYGSAEAWSFTWTGLDVQKDPGSGHKATLYYRAAETSVPGWFQAVTDSADGHQAVNDEGQTPEQIAAKQTIITNQKGSFGLQVNKKWIGADGQEMAWPAGYSVEYRLIQSYHLADADQLSSAFRFVEMDDTDKNRGDAYHAQATGSLTSSAPVQINDLPAYGFYTPTTEAEIEEAGAYGVELKKNQTYLVVYSYSVQETAVKDGAKLLDHDPQTVDGTAVNKGVGNTQFTATLQNKLTSLKVTKKWEKDGAEAGWPAGAKILYRVDRQAVYKGKVVADTSQEETGIFTATEAAGALTQSSPSYEITKLPLSGTWKCQSAEDADADLGIVSGGEYPVTYTYIVTELATSVKPDGNASYEYIPVTAAGEEITEAGADKGKLGAVLTNEYTELHVHKDWKQDNADIAWPKNYTISYQVYQELYLVVNGRKGAKPFKTVPYGTEGTLESDEEVDRIDLLPVNGVYTATAADAGMEAGKTYTVAYGYTVKETGAASSDAGKPLFAADTEKVYTPEATGTVNGNTYSNLAVITNELTQLQVKKAWTMNGKPAEWLGDAEVCFTVDKVTLCNGREVASERVYPLTRESASLKSAADVVTVADLAVLPESGKWTAAEPADETVEETAARTTLWTKAGVEAGREYTVTYQYVVKEDTVHSKITKINGKDVSANGGFFAYPVEAKYDKTSGVYVITNDFTQINVEKKFPRNATGTEATVQLYSSTVAPDGSTSPETFRITVQVPEGNWKYENGDPATAPQDHGGYIKVDIVKTKNDTETIVETLTLTKDDSWIVVSSDLEKDESVYSVRMHSEGTNVDGAIVTKATVNSGSEIQDTATVNLNAVLKDPPPATFILRVAPQWVDPSNKLTSSDTITVTVDGQTKILKKGDGPVEFTLNSAEEGNYTIAYSINGTNLASVDPTSDSIPKNSSGIVERTVTGKANTSLPYNPETEVKIKVRITDWYINNNLFPGGENNDGWVRIKIEYGGQKYTLTLNKYNQWLGEIVVPKKDGNNFINYSINDDGKDEQYIAGLNSWSSNNISTSERSEFEITLAGNLKTDAGISSEKMMVNIIANGHSEQPNWSFTPEQLQCASGSYNIQSISWTGKNQFDQNNGNNTGTAYLNNGGAAVKLYGTQLTYYFYYRGDLPNTATFRSDYDGVTIDKQQKKITIVAREGTVNISLNVDGDSSDNLQGRSIMSVGSDIVLRSLKRLKNSDMLLSAASQQVDYLVINPGASDQQNSFTQDQINQTGQTPPEDIHAVANTSVVLDGTADEKGEYDSWKAEWKYLPTVDANGNHIYYYVVETGAKAANASGMTADYKVTQSDYMLDGGKIVQIDHVDIVNTPTEQNKVTVTAKKQWQQADETPIDPKHFLVEFALYSDEACTKEVAGAEHKTITGNGSASWPNLEPGTYYVKEVQVAYITTPGQNPEVLWPKGEEENPYFVSAQDDTITNQLPTVNISAKKAWQNANGTANPPAGACVTFTLLADGEPTEHTVALDGQTTAAKKNGTLETGEFAAWTASFCNLPKFNSEGVEISYEVSETGTWTNYTPDRLTIADKGVITNKIDRGNLSVMKTVELDGKGSEIKKDYYITISTTIDGMTYYVTNEEGALSTEAPTGDSRLKVSNGETKTIRDLPVGTYTVQEDTQDAGALAIAGYTFDAADSVTLQTPAVTKDGTAEANLVNSYTEEKTSFKAVKEWKDYNPGTDEITTSVTFKLHRAISGTEDTDFNGGTITLPADADEGSAWEKTWTDLQKYGKITPKTTEADPDSAAMEGYFDYYVTEESVTDSKDTGIDISDFVVTNADINRSLDAKDDPDAIDTQTVTNTKNAVSLTVEKNWTGLPSAVTSYSYTITFLVQQYNEETRMWEDYDGPDEGTEPDSYTMTCTSADGGSYADNVVGELPAGRQYRAVETAYSITLNDSLPVEKTVTVNGSSAADGENWKSVLTNKWENVTIELFGSKTWIDGEASHADPKLTLKRKSSKDGAEEEILRADKASPTVYKPDADPADTNLVNLQPEWTTENGARTYHYYDLPKYDEGYNEYVYIVTEDPIPNYQTQEEIVSAYEKNFVNPQVASLNVTKRWFPGSGEEERISVDFVLQKKVGAGEWTDVRTYTLPKTRTVTEDQTTKEVKSWEELIDNLPLYEQVTVEHEGETQTTTEPVSYRVYETKLNGTPLTYPVGDISVTREGEWVITNPGEVELTPGQTAEATINNDKEQISLSGKKTWITKKRADAQAAADRLPDLQMKLWRKYVWETTDGGVTTAHESDWEDISTLVQTTNDPYETYHFEWGQSTSGDNQALTWSYAFTHLPKYETADGITKTARYRVQEVMTGDTADKFISSGEYSEGEIDPATGYIRNADFTNTEKTFVEVSKIWMVNDAEMADPYAFGTGDAITLHLYRKGSTVNAVNNLRYQLVYSDGSNVDADPDGKADIIEVTDGTITLQRMLKPESTTEYEWPKVKVLDLERYEANGSELTEYTYYFTEEEAGGWTPKYYNAAAQKWDAVATSALVPAEGKFQIANMKYTVELPSTGGIGTRIFTIPGGILVLGASAALVKRRRRSCSR